MRRATMLIGLALTIAGPPAPAGAQMSPDLAAQLSYPFLAELTAADRADRIAWVSVVKGVRTVWTATGPDYRPAKLFSTGNDDGQELTNVTVSPDGKMVTWVRGGDHDANWEANGNLQPAPGSATDQPQMELWSARPGTPAVKLAEGDSPAVSGHREDRVRQGRRGVERGRLGAREARAAVLRPRQGKGPEVVA